MSDSSFNLIDEPWVLVRDCDGKIQEVSLTELFTRMDTIREIVGELPTQAFAVFRTVLAIAYRALAVDTADEWFEWYQDPQGAQDEILDYLRHFHDRFDLRHPEYPFYQVAELRSTNDESKPLTAVVGDVPSGYQFFTTRLIGSGTSISWAEAARWLIYVQQFDPSGIRTGVVGDNRQKGGKSYPIGTGWSGQIGGLYIDAENLFSILMRNIVPAFELTSSTDYFAHDCPAWERVGAPRARDNQEYQEPYGPIDLLTWQARRVRLIGDDCKVSAVVLTNGDRISPRNLQKMEPLTTWRFSEPQSKKFGVVTYMPKTHNETDQVWRGLPALISQLSDNQMVKLKSQSLEVDRFQTAAVLRWSQKLLDNRCVGDSLSPILCVRLCGAVYGTQSAVITEIVNDEIEFPISLLHEENNELALVVRDALELIDKVGYQVYRLVSRIAGTQGLSPEDGKVRGENAKRQFYTNADQDFRQWLRNVSSRSDLGEWKGRLLFHALQIEEVIARSIPSAKILEITQHIYWYRREINKLLNIPQTLAVKAR